jgi:alkanesulfonate monooxygenase SsuD/methylene tetrahydromethanopterin reductase-like flavin-dependent oxidoreductase (luciferase family)
MTSLGFGLDFLPPYGMNLFDYFQKSIREIEKHFSTLWICDHFQFQQLPWYEGWTALTYLAGRYPEFNYGNLVLCAGYRNPAMLGKMASTLQSLTNGHFILGLGAGWHEEEYLSYGYGFPPKGERVARLEESVKVIRKLWNDLPANYSGKYYHLANAFCVPKAKNEIPILIAGGGQRMLRITARLADAWNGIAPAENFRVRRDYLEKECAKIKRDFGEIKLTCVLPVNFDQNALESIEKVGPPLPNVDQTIVEIQKLIDLGVSHIQVRFQDVGSFETFCDKVAPAFGH